MRIISALSLTSLVIVTTTLFCLPSCNARYLKKNEGQPIQPDETQEDTEILSQIKTHTTKEEDPPPVYTYSKSLEDRIPKFIENIDFLGQGYNLFYGNPHSTFGLDPGYKNFRISSLEYPQAGADSLSYDRQYLQPKGTRVLTQQSCSISFSSKAITSLESYQQSLKVSISVGASFGPASFSASADYQNVRSGLQSQSSIFIESGASCVVCQAGLVDIEGYQPLPSPQFTDLMKELEAAGDNETFFYDTFDKIGTHVTEEIKLGSLFGYIYSMSTTEFENLQSQKFNFELSASLFSVKASVKTSFETEQKEKFSSAIKSWKAFSVGAQPDPSNDASTWATQTLTNPMPVYSSLISLPQYLSKYNSKNQMGLQNPSAFNDRMIKYLVSYCENRIKMQGKVTTCDYESINAPVNYSQTAASFNDKYLKGAPIFLTSYRSGKAFVVQSGTTRIEIQTYKGYQNQKWYVQQSDRSDSYLFRNADNSQCMTVQDCQSSSKGSPVITTQCNPGNQCQWFRILVLDEKSGMVKITNYSFNSFLTIDMASEEEGHLAVVNPESDEDKQKIKFWLA